MCYGKGFHFQVSQSWGKNSSFEGLLLHGQCSNTSDCFFFFVFFSTYIYAYSIYGEILLIGRPFP